MWLRRSGKDDTLHFAPLENNHISDLMDFTECLVSDDFGGFYQGIDRICMRDVASDRSLNYNDLSAQIWTLVDRDVNRDSAQSVASMSTELSSVSVSPQSSSVIMRIGEAIEASRIIFFCDASTFVLFGKTIRIF
jgi:hypothetical protein